MRNAECGVGKAIGGLQWLIVLPPSSNRSRKIVTSIGDYGGQGVLPPSSESYRETVIFGEDYGGQADLPGWLV
jgi:hypothetical protein